MFIYGSHLRIFGNYNFSKAGKYKSKLSQVSFVWEKSHEWAKTTAIMKSPYPETKY